MTEEIEGKSTDCMAEIEVKATDYMTEEIEGKSTDCMTEGSKVNPQTA